jgi:hypothetical protein
MPGLLVFALPDGHTVEVADPVARLICDRLWEQGIVAGAATAATRIHEALHTHDAFRSDVNFKGREVQPLIEAAQVHPPTWTLLLQEADFATLPEPQRQRLLEVCDELIEALNADTNQTKVRALLAELELLRNNLRAASD